MGAGGVGVHRLRIAARGADFDEEISLIVVIALINTRNIFNEFQGHA